MRPSSLRSERLILADPSDIRLRRNEMQEADHGTFRIQHALVHVDIDDLRPGHDLVEHCVPRASLGIRARCMTHGGVTGRVGVEEECGSAAVYLASKMSAYVTGTIHHIDGGTWAANGWVRSRAGGHWTLVEGR